jgi:hypothetical protein
MDTAEAKFILSNHTLGPLPEGDPKVDAALKLVETSSELAKWWEDARKSDEAIKAKLAAFEPPADLKAALYATVENEPKSRFRRHVYQVMALAACLALFFTVGLDLLIDRSDEYQGPLAQRAYEYSYDGPRLSYYNKDTQRITDWLAEQQINLPTSLPPKLLEQEGIGCRPLNWSENKVAIMCFNADTVYHLYVAKSDDFKEFEATNEVAFDTKDNGWTVSRWTSGDYALVLTAKATQQELSGMLANYTP